MVPDQSWQQALLTQGLLVVGALARYAIAWLSARTRKLQETEEE